MGAPACAQAKPSTDGPCITAERTGAGDDILGNLTNVTLPGGPNIDYIPDGLNHRVGKKLNTSLTKGFLWADQLRILAELGPTNNIVSTFVYGTKVNVPEYMTKAGVNYRIVTDHLGSVRLVVKVSDGSVAQRMDYDEFGVVTADTNPGFQPFGFAGGLYDPDTQLVRFGARDYDATVGRWLSKDPIRFDGGQANVFVYVGNDPVNGLDPNGLEESLGETIYRWINSGICLFTGLCPGTPLGDLLNPPYNRSPPSGPGECREPSRPPNKSWCKDAALQGDVGWEAFCRAIRDRTLRGICFSKEYVSDQEKTNWCENYF